jgi:hypothetical protein
MDLRIALSPVQLSCRNMLHAQTAPPGGGACYSHRNDDLAASFRKRDNAGRRNDALPVKSLFNRLNPLNPQDRR